MDSGTTLLRLPLKVFDAVVDGVARASLVSLGARMNLGEHQVMTTCWAVLPSILMASLRGFKGCVFFNYYSLISQSCYLMLTGKSLFHFNPRELGSEGAAFCI